MSSGSGMENFNPRVTVFPHTFHQHEGVMGDCHMPGVMDTE
jgi:hypothetical protein